MVWKKKISELAKVCNGEVYSFEKEIEINDFSIDARTIKPGNIFVGIKGENFDGNHFYEEAFEKGASLVILNDSIQDKLKDNNKNIILVKDTRLALAALAESYIKELNIPVIGITGSVGKTSTRDIIYSVVSKKCHAFKTKKNYNNDIGMPLSILSIKDEKIAVLEMGMNHLCEISYLSNIAKPDIAIITHILPVHIEQLGTIENILKAKMEILEGLKDGGYFIFNNDSSHLRGADKGSLNTVSCGMEYNDADLQVIDVNNEYFTLKYKEEKIKFHHQNLTLPFIQNCLYAIAVGIILEIPFADIKDAINNFELTEGRLEHIELNNDIILINDAYNACTASMKNAADYLDKQEGKRKIAIFGNMHELGGYAKDLHSEVGTYLSKYQDMHVFTVGNDAKYINKNATINNKQHFDTIEELNVVLKNYLQAEDAIIVKASNAENFSKILDFIQDLYS